MTEREFSEAVAKALRLCRDAAGLKLPVEEMLEFLDEARETMVSDALEVGLEELKSEGVNARADELEALREIIAAVAEVAAIGAHLPPEPGQPAEPTYPLPGNLREA